MSEGDAGCAMFQMLFQGDLFADYHQFYIRDEAHPNLPDDYTDETIARRLMAGPHAVIVHTARNMDVPVCVEWHRARPEPDLDAYQHVVEAGLSCPTGSLMLAGLTHVGGSTRLAAPVGPLGLRASFSGLDTLSADGLEGDDRYLVQLWPGAGDADAAGVRVLKPWPPT